MKTIECRFGWYNVREKMHLVRPTIEIQAEYDAHVQKFGKQILQDEALIQSIGPYVVQAKFMISAISHFAYGISGGMRFTGLTPLPMVYIGDYARFRTFTESTPITGDFAFGYMAPFEEYIAIPNYGALLHTSSWMRQELDRRSPRAVESSQILLCSGFLLGFLAAQTAYADDDPSEIGIHLQATHDAREAARSPVVVSAYRALYDFIAEEGSYFGLTEQSPYYHILEGFRTTLFSEAPPLDNDASAF